MLYLCLNSFHLTRFVAQICYYTCAVRGTPQAFNVNHPLNTCDDMPGDS